ncbi:MAG: type II toxin-antitoxin system RelE/ParE family toxin [Oscillospiraceae bacterium]|nr:type II toxin-antitoxin system RelE/ParE family toxin [Oscillospiraceae bacterium]
MKYKVIVEQQALKQLKKLDKFQQAIIVGWIRKNLEGCDNPRIYGRSLTANLSGKWRYRIGDYRIIANISDCKVIIYVLEIGHRKDIYK